MNLVDQRCLNHALREAAVQCPSCNRFFCRECVTEHQGRMICVGCVIKSVAAKPRTRLKTGWTLTAVAGLLIAWLVFYYLGLTLARIPSEFHGEPESSVSDQRVRPILSTMRQRGAGLVAERSPSSRMGLGFAAQERS